MIFKTFENSWFKNAEQFLNFASLIVVFVDLLYILIRKTFDPQIAESKFD